MHNSNMYHKLCAEFETFRSSVMSKPADEIFHMAHEISKKKEIVAAFSFEEGPLEKEEAEALLPIENLLDYLYGELQMSAESDLGNAIRNIAKADHVSIAERYI